MNKLSQTLGEKEKELRDSAERCSRLTSRVSSLRQHVHRYRMRSVRGEETHSHTVEKAVERARNHLESASTKRVKRPDGRIEDWVRDLVVELVALDGVPTARVPKVIARVRHSFALEGNGDDHNGQTGGDTEEQTISDRSVRRMLVESYIKAFMHTAELLTRAPCQSGNLYRFIRNELTFDRIKAWTASGDSTSCKGAGIGSHFSTFPPVPFQQDVIGVTPGVPFHQFLASTREVNHKTSTQLGNWLTLFNDIVTIHNDSPSGSKNPIILDEIVRKVTGYSGDHAADQKKLAKEFCERKREAVVRFHGRGAMSSMPSEEVEEVMTEKFLKTLREMGGWECWEKSPLDDQLRLLGRLIEDTERHFGWLKLARLPDSERRIGLLFVRSWCAMHKDLNTFKAGAIRLGKFWNEEGLDPPVKLLSREQEKEVLAAEDKRGDDVDRTVGGAVKLTSLIGALVNNKDEGKGCFDEFRTYTHDHIGRSIAFPDTSNTRYQCYGDAAAEIVQRPDLYINFINQHGMKKRRAAGPNHMESNILKGLMDPKTMTEVAVLALYHESVSKPYAMQVRGLVNEHKNALDLGPLHADLVAHCNAVIDNPMLLTGDAISHTTGAFCGTPWNQFTINSILSHRDRFPHLDRALVAFFKGACERWPAFTEEFAPNSEISQLTPEEKTLAFRSPTNDHNEGSGAMYKQWSRRAPRMTTHQKNARMQVQLNGPGLLEFSHSLGDEDHAFTRRKARELDAAKLPLKERQAQATADKEAVEEEQREVERRTKLREVRKAEESKMIEGFEPILDLSKFCSLPASLPANNFLRRQLVWHRLVDGDNSLSAGLYTGMKKERMKELVMRALERRKKTAEVEPDVAMADGKRSRSSQTGTNDQPHTDTALLSDESEADLELVDEIGLCPGNARHPRCSPYIPTPAQLSNPPALTLRISNFGCKWDPINYSCSYDCAFMTFAWIYFYATKYWRATWMGQSRGAKTLSHHLRIILRSVEGAVEGQPDSQIPALFSHGRDAFRDVLSEENPRTFERHGPVDASLIDILASLSHGETPDKYYSFISSCGGPRCNIKFLTPAGAPYMLTPRAWASITHSENLPHHESLQGWVAQWFDWKASSSPRFCMGCHAECSQTRSFLQPPWIWFEIFVEQPHLVLPSFRLSFSSHTYRLAAAIYGNGCHFVARLGTPSGTWWYYDGQANNGRPIAASITCQEDLLTCGERYTLNALVYCPTC